MGFSEADAIAYLLKAG